MDSVLKLVLLQTLYYFIAMIIPLIGMAFLMRGFFWKYVKVRISFNKFLLIKVRTMIRDYYLVGWIKDGFLLFKDVKDSQKFINRIAINQNDYKAIYRTLGINMIDINEEKASICLADYSAVSGFDTKKYSDLMIRCLQRPAIGSNFEKIVIGLLIFIVLLCIGIAYLGFQNYSLAQQINTAIPGICKGVISATTGARI